MVAITGIPGRIVNPFAIDATSPAVVRVTVCIPNAAAAATVIWAVAEVAPFTVRLFTVIPAPKLAVVVPCTQCVAVPVIVTVAVAFWGVLAGLSEAIAAGPVVIVNPLFAVSACVPVVTLTFTGPGVAVGFTVMFAVRLVPLATVTEFTVTPEEKPTVVVP
jgi:hypothetical protein